MHASQPPAVCEAEARAGHGARSARARWLPRCNRCISQLRRQFGAQAGGFFHAAQRIPPRARGRNWVGQGGWQYECIAVMRSGNGPVPAVPAIGECGGSAGPSFLHLPSCRTEAPGEIGAKPAGVLARPLRSARTLNGVTRDGDGHSPGHRRRPGEVPRRTRSGSTSKAVGFLPSPTPMPGERAALRPRRWLAAHPCSRRQRRSPSPV